MTLNDVKKGQRAKITGFSQSIPDDKREHLLSYGVVPGYWIEVVQHTPVTVIQIEHTELALERELATCINVEQVK